MSLRLLIALVLILGLSTPASAQRKIRSAKASANKTVVKSKAARSKSTKTSPHKKTSGLRNAMPKRVGEGFFSRVYQSRDGVWVMKKMRPAIAGVEKVSKAERATMAKTTVKISEALRAAGLPVPTSYVPEGKPDVIVQKFASGISFEKLEGKAKFEASKNQMKFFGQALRAAKSMKGYGKSWYIDKNRANLLFDKTGTITSWIDPVVPTSGAKVQKAIEKLQAAGAN